MTPEERKQKEDELKQARAKADAAHQAAANASEAETPALLKAADEAEDVAATLQAELDAAPPAHAAEKEEEDGQEGEDIDFEKELEELEKNAAPNGGAPARSELEKAERALHFNAKRVTELGGDPSKIVKPKASEALAPEREPEKKDDDRFVTKDDMAAIEAGKLAKTEAETKVIMHFYRTRIVRTGDIQSDIRDAYLLAHKGKIARSFEEIRRSNAVRPAPGQNGPGRRSVVVANTAPQLSASEQQTMKRRGYKPNSDGSWESKRYTMRFERGKGWVTTRKQ